MLPQINCRVMLLLQWGQKAKLISVEIGLTGFSNQQTMSTSPLDMRVLSAVSCMRCVLYL